MKPSLPLKILLAGRRDASFHPCLLLLGGRCTFVRCKCPNWGIPVQKNYKKAKDLKSIYFCVHWLARLPKKWKKMCGNSIFFDSSPEKNKSLVECCYTRNPKKLYSKKSLDSSFVYNLLFHTCLYFPRKAHYCLPADRWPTQHSAGDSPLWLYQSVWVVVGAGGEGEEQREKIQSGGGELSPVFSSFKTCEVGFEQEIKRN